MRVSFLVVWPDEVHGGRKGKGKGASKGKGKGRARRPSSDSPPSLDAGPSSTSVTDGWSAYAAWLASAAGAAYFPYGAPPYPYMPHAYAPPPVGASAVQPPDMHSVNLQGTGLVVEKCCFFSNSLCISQCTNRSLMKQVD